MPPPTVGRSSTSTSSHSALCAARLDRLSLRTASALSGTFLYTRSHVQLAFLRFVCLFCFADAGNAAVSVPSQTTLGKPGGRRGAASRPIHIPARRVLRSSCRCASSATLQVRAYDPPSRKGRLRLLVQHASVCCPLRRLRLTNRFQGWLLTQANARAPELFGTVLLFVDFRWADHPTALKTIRKMVR